ncbi:MAG: hypothetical protein JWO93_944 [Micrococcaceae bacterium]|jgi:uncharacterized protein YegP (UPF0339 family)|nr:hypothetical protein [Micrococcaceae bacterium]
MAGTFEIFQADGSHYGFRLTDDDHHVLAVSGNYDSKRDAAEAIMAVRENAAAGHIVDATGEQRETRITRSSRLLVPRR